MRGVKAAYIVSVLASIAAAVCLGWRFLPGLVYDDCRPGAGTVFAQDGHPTRPLGGDLIPLRQVADPYPVFNGIAVDPRNNVVAMTDVNRKSVLT